MRNKKHLQQNQLQASRHTELSMVLKTEFCKNLFAIYLHFIIVLEF